MQLDRQLHNRPSWVLGWNIYFITVEFQLNFCSKLKENHSEIEIILRSIAKYSEFY